MKFSMKFFQSVLVWQVLPGDIPKQCNQYNQMDSFFKNRTCKNASLTRKVPPRSNTFTLVFTIWIYNNESFSSYTIIFYRSRNSVWVLQCFLWLSDSSMHCYMFWSDHICTFVYDGINNVLQSTSFHSLRHYSSLKVW